MMDPFVVLFDDCHVSTALSSMFRHANKRPTFPVTTLIPYKLAFEALTEQKLAEDIFQADRMWPEENKSELSE
jgi:hypothetical protein